ADSRSTRSEQQLRTVKRLQYATSGGAFAAWQGGGAPATGFTVDDDSGRSDGAVGVEDALSGPSPDASAAAVPAFDLGAGQLHVPVLRVAQGSDDRPRAASVGGGTAYLGQPRGLLSAVQPEEGGQDASAGAHEAGAEASAAALYPLSFA